MYLWIVFLIVSFQPLAEGSTKKGVAHWADNFMCDDFEVLTNIAWWYDWRCNLKYFHDNNICSSVIDNYKDKFVSMIWGFYSSTNFSCVTSETALVLGPNEPNHEMQCNLSPQDAADYWRSMEGLAGNKILVSPSAAPCGWECNANTTEWFDEFFRLCDDCTIDKLATHTYWCGVDKTMDFLTDLYNRYQKPILLTEFACRHKNNDPVKVLNFMTNILPRLEAAPFIEKYAWYMARIPNDAHWVQSSASLFEADSSILTPLGLFYNEYEYLPQP